MLKSLQQRVFLLFLIGMSGNFSHAHHSTAVHYDPSRTVELNGIVLDYRLGNPHTFLHLEVEQDGAIQQWEIQAASLALLRREGFDDDTFKKGDVVTAFGFPSRVSGKRAIFGARFITGDGTTIGAVPTPEDEPSPSVTASGVERLVGRWVSPFRRGGERERATGSPLPLTPEGLAAWENYDEALSLLDTCEPGQIPSLFYPPAFIHDIRISTQEAVLYHEAYGITRTVPLDAEPNRAEPSGAFGVVSGRIEGDELVIESSEYPPSKWGIAFANSPIGNRADVPSSAEKRVTERYSVSDDGARLRIDFTITDPVYLTEPFSSHVEFTRVANDTPIYGYDCESGG